ncbi:helix-turn-helix domain-containing protein [Salicibibacter cibarius]|uniref:Helix-turn-helix domain-containing protein n=1 Tax=Salicibibacter cibarius TaxID=2743000 RepID=A0A7T6YZN2_9BACI|nr:helix-turn-helix transcriptional regulator [Salicibibacter cibarius]QQK74212.1 helix-turn-helix domain-containing protein [Salicibibacter cibarius]
MQQITPQQLKYVRASYGISQEELAEMLGVTAGMIGLIERGRRNMSAKLMTKFENALDLSAERIQEIETAFKEIERMKKAAMSV